MTVLAVILIIIGSFFVTVSSVGVIRLPDFYTRAHAIGKSETLGAILILGGLIVYAGFEISSFKILFILIFIALTNPTATHAITRAAMRSGVEPWVRESSSPGLSIVSGDEINEQKGEHRELGS